MIDRKIENMLEKIIDQGGKVYCHSCPFTDSSIRKHGGLAGRYCSSLKSRYNIHTCAETVLYTIAEVYLRSPKDMWLTYERKPKK